MVKFTGKYSLEDYKDQVTLSYTTANYTGSALRPVVSIEGLEEGKDYEVSYANNIEVGTATVTITGKGSYEGTIIKTFTITPKPDSEKSPEESGNNKPGNKDEKSPGGNENTKPNDKDEKAPKTYDNRRMLLWIVLILISSGVLATTIYKKKTYTE